MATPLRDIRKLEPGTWLHPGHADVVAALRELLEQATGDPAGWGPVRDEAALTAAAHMAAQHFALGVDDANALAELGDVVPVPETAAGLAALCAKCGDAWRGQTAYNDVPIAGAACRWLGVARPKDVPRAVRALRRHYVPVFVQSHHTLRRFVRSEGTPLGAIGDLGDSVVGEYTLCNIVAQEDYAAGALEWLCKRGAADVRALALGDHDYYLVPAGVAGVLRALIGRCVDECGVYNGPVTEEWVDAGTCACDWALNGLRGSVRTSLTE